MKEKQLKPKDPKKTFLRLFSYFKYNLVLFFGGIFFIIVGSSAEIGINGMISPVIDALIGDNDSGLFVKYLLIMVALVVISSISQYIGNLSMAKLAQKTVYKIREDMFSHMEKLPVSYFDKHSHGELMSTFTNDVDMLNQSLEQSASQILISFVTVVGTFTVMIILSPILPAGCRNACVMLYSIKFVSKRSAKNYRMQQAALGDMNGYTEEMMSGQKVVKVFNYEDRAIDTFSKKNEELRNASTLASTYGVMLMPIMGNLSFVMYAIISMLGAYLVMINQLSIGNIASFFYIPEQYQDYNNGFKST